MRLATFNSLMHTGFKANAGSRESGQNQRQPPSWCQVPPRARRGRVFHLILGLVCLFGLNVILKAHADDALAQMRRAFEEAKKNYQANPQDAVGAWHLARATFDL